MYSIDNLHLCHRCRTCNLKICITTLSQLHWSEYFSVTGRVLIVVPNGRSQELINASLFTAVHLVSNGWMYGWMDHTHEVPFIRLSDSCWFIHEFAHEFSSSATWTGFSIQFKPTQIKSNQTIVGGSCASQQFSKLNNIYVIL